MYSVFFSCNKIRPDIFQKTSRAAGQLYLQTLNLLAHPHCAQVAVGVTPVYASNRKDINNAALMFTIYHMLV